MNMKRIVISLFMVIAIEMRLTINAQNKKSSSTSLGECDIRIAYKNN